MDVKNYTSICGKKSLKIHRKSNDKGLTDIPKNESYSKEKVVDSAEEEFSNAAARGDLRLILMLLSKSVSIDSLNSRKQTALIVSCLNGQVDVVKFLMAKKASVDIYDDTGYLVLHHACLIEHIEILMFLLEKVDPNLKDRFGQTILHVAVKEEKYNTLDLLIHTPKIDFNIQDSEGNTVVHIAVVKRNIKILTTLLAVDVDLSICNKDGMNPINLSIHSNELKLLKIFVNSKQGMKTLYFKTKYNESNLQIAIRSNFWTIVDYLLKLKDSQIISSETDDQDGLTCLHWAAFQNNKDIIGAILEISPSMVNVQDRNGCTVLEQVIDNYDKSKPNHKCLMDIAIQLICHEADIDLVINKKSLQRMLKDIFETRLISWENSEN